MKKIIARLRGGLGNQLFCYAAARRLALVNDAQLVIDDVTGFVRDRLYHRYCMLDHFKIPVRKADRWERLEPFERYRRGMMKYLSRRRPFFQRRYLEEAGSDFDPRLLSLKVNGPLYLDGLWQSEGYFKDVEQIIRKDLQIIPPEDGLNRKTMADIQNCQAVALHVRWFDSPGMEGAYNLSAAYYQRAIDFMETRLESPRYFIFSDNPDAAQSSLDLPRERVRFVSHNQGDANAYADLWLMSHCLHFIMANSTFSWWGAWLGNFRDKVVVAPRFQSEGKAAWGFAGLIPEGWLLL